MLHSVDKKAMDTIKFFGAIELYTVMMVTGGTNGGYDLG